MISKATDLDVSSRLTIILGQLRALRRLGDPYAQAAHATWGTLRQSIARELPPVPEGASHLNPHRDAPKTRHLVHCQLNATQPQETDNA